jgi:toxin HigB-1
VIQSWANETTRDIFNGRNSKAARRIPSALWPVARRRLDAINAARTLETLAAIPGHRFEWLHGDLAGRCSLRVNQQYRVTLVWRDGHAHEVRIEDYH